MRQLITQSVVLALARRRRSASSSPSLIVPLFSTLVPPTLPVAAQPALDLRVLAVAALFTACTALGFGVFPALRAGRTGFAALRERPARRRRTQAALRAVLVTVEVTMSVILLITSGLLIRAVWRVQAIDPGFVPEQVLTLRTALAAAEVRQPGAPRRSSTIAC